jgi:KDO2-lipid IV(A) lauroyltransferase
MSASPAPEPRPDATQRVEYLAAVAVRWYVSVLPAPLARAAGAAIGWLFYVVDGRHRRLAVEQLQRAFPLKSAAECRAIARATFVHFGRLVLAVLRFSGLSPDAMRAHVEIEGEERVRAALAAGKGALFITGHFGYWELHALAHATHFPPICLLARPLDNPALHGLLERIRTATGNKLIYKQGALRRVLRALEQNEGVAVLIDQHAQSGDAVTVEFFNRPAATTSTVAVLALRTGAPLIPVFALPLPGGRYRLIYEHPVELPPATSADPVRELTQRCTDVLEMYVRRHPHLWLWMHNRWRVAEPEGEPATGDAPGMPVPDEPR